MADSNSFPTSQSALARTGDEDEGKPLLDPRVDELIRKVENIAQEIKLNKKGKIADVKEQAPLLDHRIDDLMNKAEDFNLKLNDSEKDKCGDEEDQRSLLDPRCNDVLKKIEDFNLEFKEKEDLFKKRERELVKKVEGLIKGKETQGKIVSEQKLNDLVRSFQINETEKNLPDARVDELMKKAEEFQKEKENLKKTISDLQKQVSSLIRNPPNESPDGVNFVRADETLDALQLQISDQTQDVQDWNENEIHLVYDIAEAFTCFLRLLSVAIFIFMINDIFEETANFTPLVLIYALSIILR